MGLESHVNRVLDDLGFKRRDWEWSFGDFIARSSVVAKQITDALNDDGQFKAERDGRYVVMSYTGRPSRRGRTPYEGGKRRSGGSTTKPTPVPMKLLLLHGWEFFPGARAHRGSGWFAGNPYTDNADGPFASKNAALAHAAGVEREKGVGPSGGKRRRATTAPTKPSGSLGAVVADINRLVK